VTCRPALPRDKADVLEFTKFIWGGHDYIRYVWDEWLADPQGILVTAEYSGHCVGIAKVSLSAPGQWWLQGLRVDPKFQDLKIGSHLHAYTDEWWLEHGDGVARLMTSSQRVKVHHLCEKLGYQKILEMKELEAPVLDEPCETFQPVGADEIPAALEFALNSPQVASSQGLFDIGWDTLQLTEDILASIQRQANAYWWRARDGLLLAWDDDNDEGDVLGVGLPACAVKDVPDLLRDIRRLANQRGEVGVFWITPMTADILSAAETAGYIPHKDHDIFLYEKRHPVRP
jgi:GNAT superfamily N-acetyltransferase